MRRSGMTYSDIRARMGVPKSTLSDWFRGQSWSNDIALETVKRSRNAGAMRLTVLNTVRGTRLKKVYEEAAQDAVGDFSEIKYHPLFIAGVMAYWAHGDKTVRSRISFSASDPRSLKIFALFLERLCGIKNPRYRLILREDQEEKASTDYWCQENGLKPEFFSKTTRIKGKSTRNAKKHGVCTISLNSAYLKSKILKWIELLYKEIGEEIYTAGIV